ncbi:hypothetical protein FB379_10614 [Aeribacillus composti]|nr:hypothetical protein FB379_10614 [Aeribacillus composti]
MNFYPAWLVRDLITIADDFVVMEGYHSAYEAALYLIGNNEGQKSFLFIICLCIIDQKMPLYNFIKTKVEPIL